MPRGRGANALVAVGINSGAYGAIPASGNYVPLPFATEDLGETQGLIASDLLGYGRDPQQPGHDVINDNGNAMVPVDLRALGYWFKLLFGAATVTTGVAATGSYSFAAQPATSSILTVNGTAFTFVTALTTGNQILIGATLAETVRNAIVALNASVDANVSPASYSGDIPLSKILITHDTIGTGGNAFTIVAGSSPNTNATASAATLAGGATSGPKNHVFVAGALTLPDAAIEIGFPDVPSFAMNYGVMVNTIAIALQRSGHLNATLGLIAQGEQPRTTTTAVGALVELLIERFSQFSGQVCRDGVPLGDVVSGSFNFSNGLDTVDVIRPDGRIGGIDPGQMSVTGQVVIRFASTTLLDLATTGTPIELLFGWAIGAGKTLQFKIHQVYLPKPKIPVTGPGGVQLSFDYQGAEHPTLHRTLTATLVNDVTSY